MNWRLYRLPGSREIWHVDNGEGTQVYNVRGFEMNVPSRSVDIGNGNPRAWVEIEYVVSEFYIINGIATWNKTTVMQALSEAL